MHTQRAEKMQRNPVDIIEFVPNSRYDLLRSRISRSNRSWFKANTFELFLSTQDENIFSRAKDRKISSFLLTTGSMEINLHILKSMVYREIKDNVSINYQSAEKRASIRNAKSVQKKRNSREKTFHFERMCDKLKACANLYVISVVFFHVSVVEPSTEQKKRETLIKSCRAFACCC